MSAWKKIGISCDLVRDALELMHKEDLLSLGALRLGEHDLFDLAVVRERLPDRLVSNTLYRGQVLCDFFDEVIERLHPKGMEDLNKNMWRCYRLLKEFNVEHESAETVMNKLGLRQTSFYFYKDQAYTLFCETVEIMETAVLESRRVPYTNINFKKEVYSNRKFIFNS